MAAADDGGLIAQAWIVAFFHAGIEGVAIHVRDGKPVGFALYTFNYSVWTAARGIFIEDIWVVPEERRGGVARAMMQALAQECAARGFKRIDLNVLDWNPARGFYERIGFKWIRNWLPYRLSGEALEKLAQG